MTCLGVFKCWFIIRIICLKLKLKMVRFWSPWTMTCSGSREFFASVSLWKSILGWGSKLKLECFKKFRQCLAVSCNLLAGELFFKKMIIIIIIKNLFPGELLFQPRPLDAAMASFCSGLFLQWSISPSFTNECTTTGTTKIKRSSCYCHHLRNLYYNPHNITV